MEIKIESKIGRLRSEETDIYSFLSDCNNFKQFATTDKVQNWHSDNDSCSFLVDGIGELTFRIVEKEPNALIKFAIESAHAENIFLWIQLKSAQPSDTRIKLTTKLEANPLTKMFISKPLKEGLDKIIDVIEQRY